MKKQILWLFLSVTIFNIANAQDNPRRFKTGVAMCPIDYGKLTTSGITPTNMISTITISVTTKTVSQGDAIQRNAKMTDKSNTIEITDTLFNYSVISNKGVAFDVVQTIGSFTLIKLWKYGKSSDNDPNQISEYKLVSELKKPAGTHSIAAKIEGVRKIKPVEVTMLSENSGITKTNVVDQAKDYYLIKTEDLTSKTEEFEYKGNAWNVGLMYLPVKIRPFANRSGVFDFSADISAGTSFAWTVHHNFRNDWTTNLLLYTGVSSVKVDSLISGGDSTFFKTPQNIVSFSPAIGIYWEKKGIQIGFVIGMDFLTRSIQKTWAYRGMPWFSLTAGVNLFKLTNNTSSKTGENSSGK